MMGKVYKINEKIRKKRGFSPIKTPLKNCLATSDFQMGQQLPGNQQQIVQVQVQQKAPQTQLQIQQVQLQQQPQVVASKQPMATQAQQQVQVAMETSQQQHHQVVMTPQQQLLGNMQPNQELLRHMQVQQQGSPLDGVVVSDDAPKM